MRPGTLEKLSVEPRPWGTTFVLGMQWRLDSDGMITLPWGQPVLMSAAAAPVARRGGLEQPSELPAFETMY